MALLRYETAMGWLAEARWAQLTQGYEVLG